MLSQSDLTYIGKCANGQFGLLSIVGLHILGLGVKREEGVSDLPEVKVKTSKKKATFIKFNGKPKSSDSGSFDAH